MEINFKPVLDLFSKAGHVISKEVFNYIPASLSSDKKFANAYAAVIALLISADKKVEVEETRQAIEFIRKSNEIKRINCVPYALDFYAGFISELSSVFTDAPMFMVKVARIIEEHIKIVEPEHRNLIIQLVCDLAGDNANQAELQMKTEILASLR